MLGSPLAADHRIMLDEESVLGLPYSAKALPFRNKNRLVGIPMDLSCLDTDVRVAIAQDQALKDMLPQSFMLSFLSCASNIL